MTEDNTHKDHRKRLKNKIRKFGTEILEDHELFEALLTYSIPRKDTNPIGHNLLDYFGSFYKVIDADYHDLMKVDGIGPESALFIKVISGAVELYNKTKADDTIKIIGNTHTAVQYFRNNYKIKENEFMVLVCLNKVKKIVKTNVFKGVSETNVSFDIRQIINSITDAHVHSIILFHTHPGGDVQPSESDISTTQTIINACLFNGIDLEDHIILNESTHFSFSKNGIVDKMKKKYTKYISTDEIFYETLIRSYSKNKDKH